MPLITGCCGFPVKKDLYYRHLHAVEVQRTFYNLPRLSTVERWRSEAPPPFRFSMKAWQLITHPATSPTYRRLRTPLTGSKEAYGFFRPTEEVWKAWEATRAVADRLDVDWIIFQCPASFRPTEENVANLRTFFSRIQRGKWRVGWEPRGPWPDDLVREVCTELDLVHVVDPFQRPPVTPDVAYFRLHGRGGYRYTYSEEELAALCAQAREFEEAWVFFNNVAMWENARTFQTLCASP